MSNSEYGNEIESSIGKSATVVGGVDLTNVLRSMLPIIEKETQKRVQATLETKERLKEEELQELQNRKLFLMTNPPQFNGEIDDPVVLSDWFMELENAFDVCKCSDDCKVLYASFMLRGKALYWWNMIKASRGKETLMNMSWDFFKELVYMNYTISDSQKRKLEEIISVDQGCDSVQVYKVKFNKIPRFGTINVGTEKKKIEIFIKGLKPSIRDRVDTANLKTFEEVVQQAEVAEKSLPRVVRIIKSKKATFAHIGNKSNNCISHVAGTWDS